MKWIYLLIAGLLEITWAITMKMSKGFTILIPSIITGVGYLASAVFLSIALKGLPLGTAYAIWTGMGIVGTTILGVILYIQFQRRQKPVRITYIASTEGMGRILATTLVLAIANKSSIVLLRKSLK